MSSPVASSGRPARQSQPRSVEVVVESASARGTSTPELATEPEPERVRADSRMSLPMREKVLDAVREETDFLSMARGEGGRTEESEVWARLLEWYWMSVERKHSSH